MRVHRLSHDPHFPPPSDPSTQTQPMRSSLHTAINISYALPVKERRTVGAPLDGCTVPVNNPLMTIGHQIISVWL